MQFPLQYSERRDCHPERQSAYLNDVHKYKSLWFDSRFGEEQYMLCTLSVDPAYQGCGAGSKMLQWGIDRAKKDGSALTLFASPGGKRLYSKMGFREAGTARTQIKGDEAFVEYPGMYWIAEEQ
jgi:GNAT superfamily N-acetyltransferase